MMVAIHQPNFFPWLGYFGKLMAADVFVILDTVQFVKGEWHNRCKVRDPEGTRWLTVPVEHHLGQAIFDTLINNRQPWRRKHLKTLEQLYGKAPRYEEYYPALEELYGRPWERLAEFSVEIIRHLGQVFNIDTPVYRSSDLGATSEDATERLVEICKMLECDTYLSGAHGRDYMELDKFSEAGLEVCFQVFQHPEYEQVYEGFQPGVSAIDALFCLGADRTRRLIEQGNEIEQE